MRNLVYLLAAIGVFLVGCNFEGEKEHMFPQRSYYYIVTEYNTAEELQNMFWEHEEAFDYIVKMLKSLNNENYAIVIDDEKKGNVCFFDNAAEISDGHGGYCVGLTDGAYLGYKKDELFEQYVNDLLVGEKLTRIDYTKGFPSISFGNSGQIYYKEGQSLAPRTEQSGSLKENWFYRVQSYV
jgi:hypothetical protein